MLGRTKAETQEALEVVRQCLSQLGLQLSEEKTRLTTYGKGYEFLGFRLSVQSRRMRRKSWEKFLDKIREITRRSRNLDETVIKKLNRVIRERRTTLRNPSQPVGGNFKNWIRGFACDCEP
ncbi:MAG: hypothetical protein ACOX6W_10865 [Lentisphaeria bacterium]